MKTSWSWQKRSTKRRTASGGVPTSEKIAGTCDESSQKAKGRTTDSGGPMHICRRKRSHVDARAGPACRRRLLWPVDVEDVLSYLGQDRPRIRGELPVASNRCPSAESEACDRHTCGGCTGSRSSMSSSQALSERQFSRGCGRFRVHREGKKNRRSGDSLRPSITLPPSIG